MAKIYNKVLAGPPVSGDKTLILDVREALLYPTPYDDWNSLTIGIGCSLTTNDDDNGAFNYGQGGVSRITSRLWENEMFFGLKNNNPNLPGENNEPFIGMLTSSGNSQVRTQSVFCSIENGENNLVDFGTVYSGGNFTVAAGAEPWYFPLPLTMTGNLFPYTYNSFCGLRYTVNNKGQSGQSISIGYNSTRAIGPMSDSDIRTRITGSSYTNCGTFPWSESGNAYPLPTTLFLRLPTQIRMRVHGLGIIKNN